MNEKSPRMRVFSGPNGSGKSTIIKYIRSYKVNNHSVEFGYYINADEIVKALRSKKGQSFKSYNFQIEKNEFVADAMNLGLLNSRLAEHCRQLGNAKDRYVSSILRDVDCFPLMG